MIANKEFFPAFKKNNIAVALAANDYYVPYMATLIKSIILNSSENMNYDIIIITDGISDDNRNTIMNMISNYSNFSIRLLNPSELLRGYDFFVRGYWCVQTYYRLLLPDLLINYSKILYLDSDMIVCSDIAELFQEDIENYLVGACYDVDSAGLYGGYESTKKSYVDKVMKLEDPYSYFQAGTLLINLEQFRKDINTEDVLKLSVSQKWELMDQDILNVVCQKKVKYVDMRWNVVTDLKGKRIDKIIPYSPKWLQEQYMISRKKPFIVHYAGPEKPWNYPEMDFADLFWDNAKDSFYIDELEKRKVIFEKQQKGLINKIRNSLIKVEDSIRLRGVLKTILRFIDKIKNR